MGQIALVFGLILVNAVCSGTEMALISLRESQLHRLERASRSGRVLARLSRDPNGFLAPLRIGITLAGFLASAAAAVTLAAPLTRALGFLGGAAEPAAILLVTAVLTFVTLVLGELAPKRIARQHHQGWALLAARPIDALSAVSRPLVWVLSRATDLLVRLAGGDPRARREEVSPEEIRDMVAGRRDFSAEQRTIISGAFEIADRILREILVPRRDVLTLATGSPAAQALGVLIGAGRSRAPVVGPAGLDDVVGIVHLRDLIGAAGPVDAVAHQVTFLPDTLRISDALRQLRLERQQLALVVDERGTVDGIVTMKDLVEEVVGEIYDETDADVAAVVREPDGALLLPGSFPLHDLPGIGFEPDGADESGFTTVAGMMLSSLGHIPTGPGEVVTLPGFTAEVAEVTGRAITGVRLRATAAAPTTR